MLSADHFFSHLLSQLPDHPRDPEALAALAFLDSKPLPKHQESWRFTDLSALLAQSWQLAPQPSLPAPPPPLNCFGNQPHHLLWVTNGYSDSTIPPELQPYSATLPSFLDEFIALNVLCASQPLHLQVKETLTVPLVIVYDTALGISAHPQVILDIAPHVHLTLIEWFQGQGWSNSLTHLALGAGSRLHHTRWQDQDRESGIHIGHTQVLQARDSHYQLTALHTGSCLSRHNLSITSQGSGTHTDLKGLTWIQGQQISDTHSSLTFEQPHSSSRHLHKNVVQDQAHAIFCGRIHVQPAAQRTDASQTSRTLLLSAKARVDTQPQLEIQADDVKCSHGATVSELDPDLIFYLQSRGIPKPQARTMLVQSFISEILSSGSLPWLNRLSTPAESPPSGNLCAHKEQN